MSRMLLAMTVAIVAVGPVSAAEETCGFGTKIDFVSSPKEAAALAKKQEKLVLVLHVSGHFENPAET